jgi:putative transcription antitermination factor YqgF
VHLKAQNGVPDWNQVEALIKEWKPDAIVVGLPLNMDGTPSEMSLRAENSPAASTAASTCRCTPTTNA